MTSMMNFPLRLRPQAPVRALRSITARPGIAVTPVIIKLSSSSLSSSFQSSSTRPFSTSPRWLAEPPAPPTPEAKIEPNTASEPLLSSFLVTPQGLSNALRKNVYTKLSTLPRIIPICAAWFMPNDAEKRTGQAAYLAGHIPKARFFDLDEICDSSSEFPHMLPTPEKFAEAMRKLGIRRDDAVVVYDSAELGIFSAPRVAWTFKVFGHPEVHILNNFKLWVDQGFPVEKGEPEETWSETDYPVPDFDVTKVVHFEELKDRIKEQKNDDAEPIAILDARSAERFDGTAAEPRPGLSSGHMPNAINIPFTDVINARTKAFLPAQELRVYFECKGVDADKPIVTSCGTGVTAAVLDAALTEAGYPEQGRRLYDGSWTEWASRAKDDEGLIVKKTKAKAKK